MATPKRTKDTPSAVARNDAGTAELLAAIRDIWESARLQAARSVNSALVQANWLIGRQIVEAEQKGKSRAAYSSRLLKTLSETLEKDYGNGFSVRSLQYMRRYAIYATHGPRWLRARYDIRHCWTHSRGGVGSEHEAPSGSRAACMHCSGRTSAKVGRQERDFYEIEAIKNGWSSNLERGRSIRLSDRLLKSRDKAGVLALATCRPAGRLTGSRAACMPCPSRIVSSNPASRKR